MAKLFQKCEGCNKRKLFIKKRTYKTVMMGKIRSQSELCRRCYKNVKIMLKQNEYNAN